MNRFLIWLKTLDPKGYISFLPQLILAVITAIIMCFYVDRHQFPLSRQPSLKQADGTLARQVFYSPVQSDVTTIISILASATRAASSLWVAGIDFRCIFFFLRGGGMKYESLGSMSDGRFSGWFFGRYHFRQKANYFILATIHLFLFGSTFFSSVLTGSVTWIPTQILIPREPYRGIPRTQAGATSEWPGISDLQFGVTFSAYTYSAFWENSRNTTGMHGQLALRSVSPLPIGSRLLNMTVPYFAVDKFEWIKDPNSTLTPFHIAQLSGDLLWGFLPNDAQENQLNGTYPAPHIVARSNILATVLPFVLCERDPAVPPDVQFFRRPNLPCFLLANVTYRAGAALCPRCRVHSPNKVQHDGSFKDLQLIPDPVTSLALYYARRVSSSIFHFLDYISLDTSAFPTRQDQAIELLSRTYQSSWNALHLFGGRVESSRVELPIDASKAFVIIWRVALWGVLHLVFMVLGLVFIYLHTRADIPWIEAPVLDAFLTDPLALHSKAQDALPSGASDVPVSCHLERDVGDGNYIVIDSKQG